MTKIRIHKRTVTIRPATLWLFDLLKPRSVCITSFPFHFSGRRDIHLWWRLFSPPLPGSHFLLLISCLLSSLVSLSLPCSNLNINIQVSLMKTLGPFSDSVCYSIYFFFFFFSSTSFLSLLFIPKCPPNKRKRDHALSASRVLTFHPCIDFVAQSLSRVWLFLWPHGLQHTRLPCPLLSPGVCLNSSQLGRWYHPTMSSCHPLLLLPSIFPSIRVFFSESALHIRWPKYWRFSISPSTCLVLYKCAHIIGILL